MCVPSSAALYTRLESSELMLRSTACNNSNARQSRARDTLRLSFRWTLTAGRQAAPLATAIPLFPQSAGVCVTRMSGGSQWSAAPTTSMCVSMALDSRSLELLTLDLRTARTLPIECAPLHRLAHRSASAELHRLVETLPISSRVSLETCCGWLAKSLLVWEAYCVHKASLILSVMYTATHRIADVQVQHL